MSDPFRDAEATALARVEDLESENQRLMEELEVARDQAGTNHQAYVKHLEDQIRDLKNEVATLDTKLAQTRVTARVAMSPAKQQQTLVVVGGVAVVTIVLTIAQHC